MISITRRYHFAASHRLHSPQLSEAENARLYGKCNNPYGHGHNYVLEISVSGPVDETTGLVLPIAELDTFMEENILRLVDHRNLNVDVPQFAKMPPTTENLVQVVAEVVERHWPSEWLTSNIQAVRIHIQETERNGFELLLKKPVQQTRAARHESLLIHA